MNGQLGYFKLVALNAAINIFVHVFRYIGAHICWLYINLDMEFLSQNVCKSLLLLDKAKFLFTKYLVLELHF